MTLREVWEKYKLMDLVLSEGRSSSDSFRTQIVSDLWEAIKEALRKEKGD